MCCKVMKVDYAMNTVSFKNKFTNWMITGITNVHTHAQTHKSTMHICIYIFASIKPGQPEQVWRKVLHTNVHSVSMLNAVHMG